MQRYQPANGMRQALSVARTDGCLKGCTSYPPSLIQSRSEGFSKRLLRLSWSAEKTRRCPAWRRVVSFQVSLFAHPLRGLLRSHPGNSAGGVQRVWAAAHVSARVTRRTRMKRRSGASVPGIASRWGCRWGGACRCGGSSAAPGAWRRVKSGRASPACHENKETKGAVRLLFFAPAKT